MTKMEIVVRRPEDHHKGPKEIVRIPYGEAVPPGILIGKGSVITIETKGD
jgi:hypothetical protein